MPVNVKISDNNPEVKLSVRISTSVRDGFKTYCDDNGTDMNKELRRFMVDTANKHLKATKQD